MAQMPPPFGPRHCLDRQSIIPIISPNMPKTTAAAMPDRLRSSAMLHFSVKNISAEERAKSCETMTELRDRVAALDGEQPVQLRMYLPHQKTRPPTEAAFRGLGVQLP